LVGGVSFLLGWMVILHVSSVVDFLNTWFFLHGYLSLVDGALGLEVYGFT
jgi:hypothetical protein